MKTDKEKHRPFRLKESLMIVGIDKLEPVAVGVGKRQAPVGSVRAGKLHAVAFQFFFRFGKIVGIDNDAGRGILISRGDLGGALRAQQDGKAVQVHPYILFELDFLNAKSKFAVELARSKRIGDEEFDVSRFQFHDGWLLNVKTPGRGPASGITIYKVRMVC